MNKGNSKREILTPRERFGLLLIDEKPDRCNIIPLITSHAAHIARIPLSKYYTDGKAMAQAQIIALEEYRHDALSFFSDVGIIAEAMGSEFEYPDDDLPVLKTPALTRKSLARIHIPDPENDKRLPVYLEAIEYAYATIGDKVPLLAYVPAPFTTGMMLSDPSKFLIQTIKQPELIAEIMEVSLWAAIEFCYHIINTGGLPIIVDPLASSSVISPRAYEKFALPYERKLIDFLHRYDLDIMLHICGETEPILDLLPNTKADLISLDRVNISLALDKLSKKMRIVGNFDTSKIAFSSPSEIEKEAKEMVRKGMVSSKGYIASTGCEVPIRTPIENVKAFIDSSKEIAWYWD